MRYSHLFGKTRKSISHQYEAKNHELLVKAGFIDQVASGIFTVLPLGKKTLSKIESQIRCALNGIGAQEILMPSLQPKALWEQSNRWNNVDILFKIKSPFGHEYALGPTHEEIITPLAKKYIKSYRDLPLSLYQISTKFRDEPRPKSGILRGREFQMKDLYSFHANREDFLSYYKIVSDTYLKIFNNLGLTKIKITEASGGSFTKKVSHEFNVLTKSGEVTLIYCDFCNFAQNEEIAVVKTGEQCPKCKKGTLRNDKAIEVGNIFDLGTKFSEKFDTTYVDRNGKKQFVHMGCYGIGISRLLGTIVEIHHDEKGILWPFQVAPFQIHLIGLDLNDPKIKNTVENVYRRLLKDSFEVLLDDRMDVPAGEKFGDADLIGIPCRLVVSKRTGEQIEYKKRSDSSTKLITFEEISSLIPS